MRWPIDGVLGRYNVPVYKIVVCFLLHMFLHYLYTSSQVYGFVFTSAKEVMFLPGFVCGFVSLYVNKNN